MSINDRYEDTRDFDPDDNYDFRPATVDLSAKCSRCGRPMMHAGTCPPCMAEIAEDGHRRLSEEVVSFGGDECFGPNGKHPHGRDDATGLAEDVKSAMFGQARAMARFHEEEIGGVVDCMGNVTSDADPGL